MPFPLSEVEVDTIVIIIMLLIIKTSPIVEIAINKDLMSRISLILIIIKAYEARLTLNCISYIISVSHVKF